MKRTSVLRRLVTTLAPLVLLAAPLAAQNTLLAELDGKYYAVQRVHGNTPIVEVDGKMVVADGHHYTLKKTEDYLPVFVELRNVEVKSRNLKMNASTVNRTFLFQATLVTPYDLDDVFLVLELNTNDVGKALFMQEVGKLEPHQYKSISSALPMAFGLGGGKYVLHLFARGQEVLHSKIPPLERDAALDRMTLRRISGVQDSVPEVLAGPGPEYPPSLLKAKTRGQAIISIRIGANGQVYDPAVKSADDPAFGQAALAAVRLWRFLPQVKGGRPVEARVDVPFNFTPPEKKP